MLSELESLQLLNQVPGIGSRTLQKIWNYYHSYSYVFYIEETQTLHDKILSQRQFKQLMEVKLNQSHWKARWKQLEASGMKCITILDKNYPTKLKELYDFPHVIYYRGALPNPEKKTIAIVGARNSSLYGEQVSELFAKKLSEAGIQVISGMAYGIDGAAHKGALKSQTPTFAVLGCGANICYPSRHYSLYESIIKTGGVLSELPCDEKPMPANFPRRNRLISAFSDGILVVEAKEKSGSLITVECGLEQGKDIFVIPGRITDLLSQGCNWLIQQGANLVQTPADLLRFYGINDNSTKNLDINSTNSLAKIEKMVYSCLDLEPKHIDQILNEINLPISQCLEVLLSLELRGYVVQTTKHYYGKKIQE